MQVAYAHFRSGKEWQESEKELLHSIEKGNDLFYYFLQLLIELQDYHEQRISLARQKRVPSEKDLNPSLNFLHNHALQLLSENSQFLQKQDERHYSWIQYPELKKKLWDQVLLLPEFQHYISLSETTIEDDKEVLKHIIRKVISENEDIFSVLQDQSIYWNVEIEFVLSIVVKTIKMFNAEQDSSKELVSASLVAEDVVFSKTLLASTVQNYEEHNAIIDEYTTNWELDRIAFMDILIMHMAINEIIAFPAIPKKVSMNEYIELAKFFSTHNSSHFINGVLDKVIDRYESENKISKTGRGLVGS